MGTSLFLLPCDELYHNQNCSLKGETYITNLILSVDNEKQVSIPEKVQTQKYIFNIVVSLSCSGND